MYLRLKAQKRCTYSEIVSKYVRGCPAKMFFSKRLHKIVLSKIQSYRGSTVLKLVDHI